MLNSIHKKTGFWLILSLIIGLIGCASRVRPYECGPVMKRESIEKGFTPILKFIDIKPGDTFAEIGASSGALTVMMSTLFGDVTIYVEDIDTTCLKKTNLDKIINFYSTQSTKDLRKINRYNLTVGSVFHTNLPDNSFDRIYTNATFHVFESPDSILIDLSKKLKPNGKLFVRDGFKGDHGAGNFCSDIKCGKALFSIEEFLALMKRNGFKLIKQSPDISGYPVFGFSKV